MEKMEKADPLAGALQKQKGQVVWPQLAQKL
jgi:hypothetical protein